ncbi:Tad domain-containing protein [Lujinxingia litoralis]|uniref:Tad domain-containing protein n=1 Tax=Lujinxingia litoralis TaxID=2211119 RepID=UPI00131444BD|nr:Tad domain-containing protein [Lujinxingia litoralis]
MLLLCLAAVLILMLMAWVVMDAGQVTRDKIEAQTSADVAAYSQASVKARAMNMLAFSNIAKRSIVGVHAIYESMFASYGIWVMARYAECQAQLPSCDMEVLAENLEIYWSEADNDYGAYGDNADYYRADMRALDNYQRYISDMAPWWGWTEAVVRAQRNGATMASSFPVPQGTPVGGIEGLPQQVINASGRQVPFNFLSTVDRLPARPGDFWAHMVDEGMYGRETWKWEHRLNTDRHRDRSEGGAASAVVLQRGATTLFSYGLSRSEEDIGEFGRPWRLVYDGNEAHWLRDTSNITLTYHADASYYDAKRRKYSVPADDYHYDDSMRSYRPEGYWGMARAEISFQGEGAPTMWESAWTARMRPVVLPREFEEVGYDFNALYHSSMLHLSASSRMQGGGGGSEFFEDLVYMEKVSRGMGQSTIDGVSR